MIRYSLMSFELGGATADVTVSRRFARTLLGERPPDDVLAVLDQLPDVFSPLRAALTTVQPTPAGLVDVMELPVAFQAPAEMEWLSRARTGEEVNDSLTRRYDAALGHASNLAVELSQLPVVVGEYDPDPRWWLHEVAANAMSIELAATLPYIDVQPIGEGAADLDLINTRVGTGLSIGRTGDSDVLERFSAGERRWLDEALATAGRELDRFAATASWQASLLGEIDDEELVLALEDISEAAQDEVYWSDSWSAAALSMVLRALEPALLNAAMSMLAEGKDPLSRQLTEATVTGLSSLRPRTVIRVFDEPEAHLHPTAQRRVATALDALRLRGDNVVLASHSPHFLDLPGWMLLHVQETSEGPTISPLQAQDLAARKALAGQMGMTRGELLTRVHLVLLVEGEHDRLILDSLYGLELEEAGVAMLRMHGTGHLLATAEMDFVERYLDVPVAVMLDYTRLDNVASNKHKDRLTDEEQKLRYLSKALYRQGRSIQMFGLDRPDIVTYLNDDAVRLHKPDFPGWGPVLRSFEKRHPRPSFKNWLLANYDVDLTHSGRIRAVLGTMAEKELQPPPELGMKIRSIAAVAQPA